MKSRVDVFSLYEWIKNEIDKVIDIPDIGNMGDRIQLPSECFTYNNDKVFASGICMNYQDSSVSLIDIKNNIQNLGVYFDIDPEEGNITGFDIKNRYDFEKIAVPLFEMLQFLFKREDMLGVWKKHMITNNQNEYIHLDNMDLFSIKEEEKLMKSPYTWSEFIKDSSKIKNTTKNNQIINNKDVNIFSLKRRELDLLFRHLENTGYPEREDIEISKYLTFDKDLDKLKNGDKFKFNKINYIVDRIEINSDKPQAGNITEYGIEIEEESLSGRIRLFRESDNLNYTFDFYKTNRVDKKHSVFFCCSLFEDQDYMYDITRPIPDDREAVEIIDIPVSDRAYNVEDFEYLRGTKIPEGKSIAEQTERAFSKEFYRHPEKLNEGFDVREWSTQYILKNFDLDLSNSFNQNYIEEPVVTKSRKRKM